MTKRDKVDEFIAAVATRSEGKFTRDPENGERPMFNPVRRQSVVDFVKYVFYCGELPPPGAKVNGTALTQWSDKRKGQILTRLAGAWLEFEKDIPATPRFVGADFFRPFLHKQLIERESEKAQQRSKKYKMS